MLNRPALKGFWPLALILVALSFLLYGNSLGNAFLYDDEFLIQKNTFLKSWESIGDIFLSSSTAGAGKTDSFYRPIQAFFYLLVFQFFGLSTTAFHLLNIVLHAINAVLVFLLGRRLGLPLLASFSGALIWSAHPIHTEAVTYMSGTADPAHTLFVLAGLVCLIPSFSASRVIFASFFYLLALMSKESAIVFPALAVACLFYLSEQRWNWRTYLPTWPFWIMALLYLVARKTVLNFDETFQFFKTENIYTQSVLVRIFTFLATLPSYLQVLVYPNDLHIDRNFPVFTEIQFAPVVGGIIILGLLLMTIVLARKGEKWLLPAWASLWFLASHSPHMGIVIPVNAIFLEHWLYLTSIGFFMCVGYYLNLDGGGNRAKVSRLVLLVIVVVLGRTTWEQNKVWASPVSLYSHILRFNPQSARVHNNLAMAYSDLDDVLKSIEHYEKAIALSDVYPESHHNLGLAYLRQGRLRDGIEQLEKAVQMNPDFFFSYQYLVHAYQELGNTAKADEYRRKYLETRRKFLRE